MEPLLVTFLVVAAAGVLARRRTIAAAGILGAGLAAWQPMAWLVSRPLESRYPRQAFPRGEAEAIVVLSGSMEAPLPELPTASLAGNTYRRCFYAAWLHRNWRPLPVLASGGGRRRYAETMAEYLRGAGVPASLVWVEDRSGSTRDSAVAAAEMLRSRGIRRIALVTEAYHMLRAERCFRKQGLETLPAPCGFRTLKFNAGEWLFPGWNPLSYNEAALHEYGGLAVYWLRGWL